MKRIILAIHGIRSPQQGCWIYAFRDFVKQDSRFKDDIFVPYYYGYVLAVWSANLFFRFGEIREFMKALRKLTNDNPDCELNIVAHSYGTQLSYQAVKRSGEDGEPSIKVNKMILVSSVVSRHGEIPYDDTLRAGKIRQLHCYCSYKDPVCRFAIFGHSGYHGFSRDRYDSKCYLKPFPDLEIYNHQVDNLGHGGYFEGTKYYKEWLDIIATG
jgi:pimeloyl-ACP methyl ester carboxylesterase